MLVISPNQTTKTGVFFCNYEEKTREELDKLLVEYKTLVIRVSNPRKVYEIAEWANGTISLAICSSNPEILKTLFMEDHRLFLGLIEDKSFLYLEEPLDMFVSFVLLNFCINNLQTILRWKNQFPKVQTYVYNAHTTDEIYRCASWNIDGILTEHTEQTVRALTNINIDITTGLGMSVFTIDTIVSQEIHVPSINIKNRSRKRCGKT